jgi:hypothetical protein
MPHRRLRHAKDRGDYRAQTSVAGVNVQPPLSEQDVPFRDGYGGDIPSLVDSSSKGGYRVIFCLGTSGPRRPRYIPARTIGCKGFALNGRRGPSGEESVWSPSRARTARVETRCELVDAQWTLGDLHCHYDVSCLAQRWWNFWWLSVITRPSERRRCFT